jgi:uncharacterized protein (DUF2236 family)
MDSYLGWKIDFLNPAGAEAFQGPQSVQWRVFKNPIVLGIGGVAAVLMEFAEPRIRSGVWDHSTFKSDPIGRSRRTGMAAMVGVYAPKDVARRIIQGVTNMHARVEGKTPAGLAYRALDVDLLDWVSATAGYGFLTAYDRFVAPVSAADKRRFWAEGVEVAKLYGVQTHPDTDEAFLRMMQRFADGFEPHPINDEFLTIIQSARALPGTPAFLRRAIARASVSILPPLVREKLKLGAAYDLSAAERLILKSMGALADRTPVPGAPPAQACRRLGLPSDFLYRSARTQARLLAR